MTDRPEDDHFSDEIRREDGVERYWLYYNGEWAETICGLCAVIAGVFWCFLLILGYSQTILGYALAAIAVLGFVCWRIVFARLDQLQKSGWAKERRNTSGNQQKKLILALLLWGFILVFFGTVLVSGFHRRH